MKHHVGGGKKREEITGQEKKQGPRPWEFFSISDLELERTQKQEEDDRFISA
jgi:hypothetical protein